MITKKEADTGRAVTATDLETIDAAISSQEGLSRFLYTTRRILGEIGKLETAYQNTKSSLAAVEQQYVQVNGELEGVKTQLAKAQQEEAVTRQRVATLAAEVKEKEQLLSNYSAAVDRIVGKAAA